MSITVNHRTGEISIGSTDYNATSVSTNTSYTVNVAVSDAAIVANSSSSVDLYYNGTQTARAGGFGIGTFAIKEGDVAGDAGARILYFTDSGNAIKASIASGSNSGDLVIDNNVDNKDINLTPSGTGNIGVGNFKFDGDQTVGAGQDNYVLTYDNGTGLISLEAAAGGGLTGTVANDQVVIGTGASSVDSSANLTFDGTTLSASANVTTTGDITMNGTTPTLELRDAGEIHFRDTVGTTEGIHLYNSGTTTANPILLFTSTALNPDFHLRDGCRLRLHDGSNADYAVFEHDGTDFNMTGVGTTDLNITSMNVELGPDGSQPWLTLNSTSSGDNWTAQGAGISVGESGKKGSATIHMTYNGDGSGYLGMGTVDDTASTGGRPAFGHFDFTYNTYDIKVGGRLFPGTNSNTVQSTKYIEATTGYGSINVAGGGTSSYAGYSINNDIAFMSNGTTHGLYNAGAGEWILSTTDNSYVYLYYDGTTALRTAPGASDGLSTYAQVKHNNGTFYDVGMNVMPRFVTNASVDLSHAQAGGWMYHSNTTTYTIQLNNTANEGASFPIGGTFFVMNYSTGTVTVNTETGTLYSPQLGSATSGSRTIGGNSVATILKYAADVWFLWGDSIS